MIIDSTISRTRARKSAAALFAVAGAASVIFFEVSAHLLTSFGSLTLIPYLAFVLFTSLLGALLGHWYLPETGLFEYISVPLLISVFASTLAAACFAISILLFDPEASFIGARDFGGLIIYVSLVFLLKSWPVLLPSMATASFAVWVRARRILAEGAS